MTTLPPCPYCGAASELIHVMERSASGEGVLEYSFARDYEEGAWGPKFPRAGQVASSICTSCARIVLVGVPYRAAPTKGARKRKGADVGDGGGAAGGTLSSVAVPVGTRSKR